MRFLPLFLALTLAAPAVAAPVEDLRKSAEEAFKAKNYAAAAEQYLEAYKAKKDPALLYNIARSYHELGDYPAAYDYYTRFAVEAPVELRAKVPHLDEKIAFVAAKTAVLKITANVLGATISVNGRKLGESGALEPVRVNAGKVVIAGTRDGFISDEQTIEAAGGATVAVTLKLVDRAGTLKVQSNVATATVTVDDKVAGRVPLEVRLPAGPHRVVATADGYEPWRRTLTIKSGEVHAADAALDRKSSTWWIWTGAAVIVVTGAVITYALLTERSADSGSFGPGQVSTGLVRF